MKKCSKKLVSLLMVFALLGGLFCNVGTVNAQETDKVEETVVTRSESARQATVPKTLYYGGVRIATINCIVAFTYGLPTGQPLVGTRTYSISNVTTGYSIGSISTSVTNGDPATITYTCRVYKNGTYQGNGTVTVHVTNSGSAY